MNALRRQRGYTLFVGLVLLFLMTLIALTTSNIVKNDLQIAINMHEHDQAQKAAQEVLDNALSSTRFTTSPTDVFSGGSGCQTGTTVSNGICIYADGTDKPPLIARLTPAPACLLARLIKNAELNLSNSEDVGCTVGASQNFGIEGASGLDDSLCADTVWQLNAVGQDSLTNATASITLGAGVRATIDAVANNCP